MHAGRKEGVQGISNFSNGVIAMLPRQKANNNLDLFKTDYSASTLFSAVFLAVFSNGHLWHVLTVAEIWAIVSAKFQNVDKILFS